jgi:rod shape-determining protein MreB
VPPANPDEPVDLKGLNVRTGCPGVLRVPAAEIYEALEPILSHIIEAIRRTIEYLPPELAGDILTEGGSMVGGGALLRGWQGRLQDALGLPIRIDEDPLMAVTRGLIKILEDRARFSDLILNSEYQPALAV